MLEPSLFENTIRNHQLGKISEAIAGYQQLLKLNPADVVALNNLALLSDNDLAEELLRKAVGFSPEYASAQINLGEVLEKKGNAYEAMQCYENALKTNRNDQRAIDKLSRLILSRENFLLSEDKNAVSFYRRWKDGVDKSDYFFPTFHGVSPGFWESLFGLMATLPKRGKFASDNLICWDRSLSFLEDARFMEAIESNFDKINCIWRVAVVAWGARHGLKLEGDFVECGTYKGGTAKVLCEYLDIDKTGKKLWLYDVFDWSENDKHFYIDGLNQGLHEWVQNRFSNVSNVHIIKGYVPESFTQGVAEKIAFLHIDMNNADAELGALEHLWDKVSPGAVVVFDDYGWADLRPQKDSADAFLAKRGYSVLELPTGQGLVIK